MPKDYLQLRYKNIENLNKLKLYLLLLIIIIFVISLQNINKSHSYYLDSYEERYFIYCNKNCKNIINNAYIFYRNKKYNYKIIYQNDNIYEVSIPSINLNSKDRIIKIREKKGRAITILFNIFKRKE